MGVIRHIAMQVPDPWYTAEFYRRVFGMEVAGEADSNLADGVYLTDGVVNMALLDFKSEEAAQGMGLNHVGLHHFGVWVDDIEATQARIEKAGGSWIMGEPDYKHNSAYEVKFHDINGTIFDITHTGWAGTQSNPGAADNKNAPHCGLQSRFKKRRDKAAEKMDQKLPRDVEPTTGQLRHFAMSIRDPWATSAFYNQVFGWKVVGETDSSLAEGVFMSDGIFNVALLDYKDDKGAQGKGRHFVGLHHFGMWIDEVAPTQALIERGGGEWLMGEPDYRHNAAYEVKFNEVDGEILDLVHNGWADTQRRPGTGDNQIRGHRPLVERYAERRERANREMAEKLSGELVPAE